MERPKSLNWCDILRLSPTKLINDADTEEGLLFDPCCLVTYHEHLLRCILNLTPLNQVKGNK